MKLSLYLVTGLFQNLNEHKKKHEIEFVGDLVHMKEMCCESLRLRRNRGDLGGSRELLLTYCVSANSIIVFPKVAKSIITVIIMSPLFLICKYYIVKYPSQKI